MEEKEFCAVTIKEENILPDDGNIADETLIDAVVKDEQATSDDPLQETDGDLKHEQRFPTRGTLIEPGELCEVSVKDEKEELENSGFAENDKTTCNLRATDNGSFDDVGKCRKTAQPDETINHATHVGSISTSLNLTATPIAGNTECDVYSNEGNLNSELQNVQDSTSAEFLQNVVADLNAPNIHDYMMYESDENHDGHPYDLEMSDLGPNLNTNVESPGSSGSSASKFRANDLSRVVSIAAKKARNMGEEYVSPDGTVVVKARKMGPGCGFSCRYKCHDKISEIHRSEIFTDFWKMGSHARRWDFISKHVKVMKKKSSTSTNESRRQLSRVYYFRVLDDEVQVCKTMFTHTLGVWDQWIETAIRKKSLGNDETSFSDMRGKHTTNQNRSYGAKPESKASVMNHIKMFIPIDSREIKQQTDKQFLDEGLSVSAMHKLYQEWATRQQVKPATLRQYRDIFNRHFNLSFFVPKKDHCLQCYTYNSASSEDKLAFEESYQQHVKNKIQDKELKLTDVQEARARGNNLINVACFDMQRRLETPKGRNSLLYYTHKLSVFNFTIADVILHSGYCYVWHEGMGRKGSHEIASFLLHYLVLKTGEGVEEFRFYCKDCFDLNKNKIVFAMLNMAAIKLGIKIKIRYLESGHNLGETDSMHSLIDKRGKDYEICIPDDWIKVMESAKNWRNPQGESANPYIVTEVEQDMIYNFDDLVGAFNWDIDTTGRQVPWEKVREVSFDKADPGFLYYKVGYDDTYCKVYTDLDRVDLMNFPLKKAYEGGLAIPQTKLNDLLNLCGNAVIPSRYHRFYQSLHGSRDMEQPECVREIEPREVSCPNSAEEGSSDGEDSAAKKPRVSA